MTRAEEWPARLESWLERKRDHVVNSARPGNVEHRLCSNDFAVRADSSFPWSTSEVIGRASGTTSMP